MPYAVSSWDTSVLQLLLAVNVLQTEKRQPLRTPSVSPPEDEQGQEPQGGRQGARVSAAPPRKVLPPADPPSICTAVAGRICNRRTHGDLLHGARHCMAWLWRVLGRQAYVCCHVVMLRVL